MPYVITSSSYDSFTNATTLGLVDIQGNVGFRVRLVGLAEAWPIGLVLSDEDYQDLVHESVYSVLHTPFETDGTDSTVTITRHGEAISDETRVTFWEALLEQYD